ncbi:MAG: YIP1 family protein [Chitinophagaceae bacterium]|nr:YIP1 family protein [Chitinophagaceae bacterium]
MNSFFKYYFKAFAKPKESFSRLLQNPRYFKLGFLFMLVPIAGYTLMYIFLTIANGAPSVLTPWLNIEKDDYYAINRFLLAPSMLLCWVAAASFIQIVGRLQHSNGTYEQTLSVLALAISIAMCFSLLHDLPMSFFSAIGVIDARQHEIDMNSPGIWRTLLWFFYSLYGIAFLILFPLAVKVVHGFNTIKSIVTGWLAFILFQLLFLLFNR